MATYQDVAPRDVKARQIHGEPFVLLDVREPDEVAEWAYPDAINIPLGELAERIDELPAGQTVIVACHVGARSAAAAEFLADQGWVVENVIGGAVAWQADDEAAAAGAG